VKLAISGAAGRMGQAVTRLALAAGDVTLVGAVDARGSARLGADLGETAGVGALGVAIGDDPAAALLGAEVLVDFSSPAALPALLRAAVQAGVPVVCGTTGLDQAAHAALDRAAERIAVLWAPNMSIGVQVLRQLLEQAVRALGPGYDIEIVETHHGAKVDAPSGTALELMGAVREAQPELEPVHGRQGRTGPRRAGQIGLHAVRGGGVVGDHQIHLLGALERLELTHRAIHRDVFAAGALRAARYLVGKPPGRYPLRDVIA
jgi:4-hydroxy-tetrahydrodipicolinate reductase